MNHPGCEKVGIWLVCWHTKKNFKKYFSVTYIYINVTFMMEHGTVIKTESAVVLTQILESYWLWSNGLLNITHMYFQIYVSLFDHA